MKKLILIGSLTALMFGCGDEKPEPNTSSYPTDGLSLNETVNPLLLTGYVPDLSIVPNEIFRQLAEYEYTDRLNHVSLVTEANSVFYSGVADTIRLNFMSPTPPYFILDWEEVVASELLDAVEENLDKKPLVAIAHKVSENDTAWVVDNKVKILKDTVTNNIYIETYMLGKIKATYYDGLNLLMPKAKDMLAIQDSTSLWDMEVRTDGKEGPVVIAKGDTYYHNYILLDSYNNDNAWGTPLSTYSALQTPEFFKGDVLGTRHTPIRHYFLKPETEEEALPFEFTPQFLSVVWIRNASTGNWEYLNSFMTD